MKPLVSVCCMTYNHEKYIRSCLDGFLLQETDFPFEVWVHDDASTDKNAEIIREYETKYPHLFKAVCQIENQFLKQNTLTNLILPMAQGKYIALCEGDDFWTDKLKLQKQVSFLEDNPSFSMSFHSVQVMNEISNVTYKYPVPDKNILKFADIFRKHYIPTCSLLFRRSFLPNPLPEWFETSKIGDIPLELMLADKGDVYFIEEKMGCYRRNEYSLTSTAEQIKNGRRLFLYVYTNMNRFFHYKYWHLFYAKILKLRLGYIKDFFRSIKKRQG